MPFPQVQDLRDKLVAIRESQRKLLAAVPRPASASISTRAVQGQLALTAGTTRAGIPGLNEQCALSIL
jgi:hypothetical protein